MMGDNIRSKRETVGMTLSELAKRCNLSVGYLSDIENNKKKNPSYETLDIISKVLNTTISDLVEEVVLYDSDDIELSDISKIAPLIIDVLRRAAESDPELARALKDTFKSQNKIFFLSNLIKKVMYNAASDDLHIEFNDKSYSNKVNEVIKNYTPAFLTKIESNTVVPVLGVIRAGEPIYAEQNIIDKMPIPDNQLNHGGEYFGLLVEGDSMTNAGILDGSYVIVRKQEEVENGEIAVVLVDRESVLAGRISELQGKIKGLEREIKTEESKINGNKKIASLLSNALEAYRRATNPEIKNRILKEVVDCVEYKKEKHQRNDEFTIIVHTIDNP